MAEPLFQPVSGILGVPYAPDSGSGGDQVEENPPRFTWMPACQEGGSYELQIAPQPDFADNADILAYSHIPYNLFTPDRPLPPGRYYWRYALTEENKPRSEWSAIRSFTIRESLPLTPLPGRSGRYNNVSRARPRLWLPPEQLVDFRGAVRQDPATYGWEEFRLHSADPWLSRPLIPEPQPYPENKRVAKLWRQMYMDCQEMLYAIRHLAVAGVVLEDESLIAKAKEWLLHGASWDTEGTTNRDYNDEAAFRMAGALAWGYDWLHSHLTEEERQRVREALLKRTRQVAFHVMERSRIHHVPYDSHAVRSLSSVLVPCCIALLDEEEEAREWLDYTLEYFSALYTPWGGRDGGWAEGVMYWTTQMAFVTEALNLVHKYTGINFYNRPFFRKTGDFPLYCLSPDTLRASFCDQSSLGDPVSLKTGMNIRQFAGLTGNGLYQWYYERTRELNPDTQMLFYNYGWWDFRFDEMVYRTDYPQVAAQAPVPAAIEPVKWFKDVGWVAMHHRMDDPEEHIMLLAKSSRYGSVSHSHGDQNAFLLHAFGEPLAIESGYYVAFNSTMHMQWRKTTRSKNVILIDGQGQYAGTDKTKNMAASGTVLAAGAASGAADGSARSGAADGSARSGATAGSAWPGAAGGSANPGNPGDAACSDCSGGAGARFVRMDATEAYREHVPYIRRYVREIHFFDHAYIVIADYVDLERPGRLDWLFHTLYPMTLKDQTFTVNGRKAQLEGRFVYSSSGDLRLSQTGGFAGVDPKEWEGQPEHWHLTASTREAKSHRLVTLLTPRKPGSRDFVSYFMDDQDHGVHLYLTNQGITHRLEIPKAY
ncbi:MAG: alginate lyase [Paenibacillaceae bacterium]|nr:alginate lyase [Paenibacillaceae bacterium]